MLKRFETKPNGSLKRVAGWFADERPNDRIGTCSLCLWSLYENTVTSDKAVVLEAIKSIKYDNVYKMEQV
jgi:Ca-activated chloride channel family protein